MVVWGMVVVLVVILIVVVLFLFVGLSGWMKFEEVWGGWWLKDLCVNWFLLVCMFLFGVCDVWFVVGILVYF